MLSQPAVIPSQQAAGVGLANMAEPPQQQQSAAAPGDAASTLQLLEAHDMAARAAATAASFMRLGEPLSQAVADAQLVMDAPGSVDADCAGSVTTACGPQAAGSTHTQPATPQSSHDLVSTQLAAPPASVVRDAMLGMGGLMPGSGGHTAGSGVALVHGMILRSTPTPPGSSVASVAGSAAPSMDTAELHSCMEPSAAVVAPPSPSSGAAGKASRVAAAVAAAPAGVPPSAAAIPVPSSTEDALQSAARLGSGMSAPLHQPLAVPEPHTGEVELQAGMAAGLHGAYADTSHTVQQAVATAGEQADAGSGVVQLGMHVLGMGQQPEGVFAAGDASTPPAAITAAAGTDGLQVNPACIHGSGSERRAAAPLSGSSPAQVIGGSGLGAHSGGSMWAAAGQPTSGGGGSASVAALGRTPEAGEDEAGRHLVVAPGAAAADDAVEAVMPELVPDSQADLLGSGSSHTAADRVGSASARGSRHGSASLPVTPTPTPQASGLLLATGASEEESGAGMRPGSRAPVRTRSAEPDTMMMHTTPPSTPPAAAMLRMHGAASGGMASAPPSIFCGSVGGGGGSASRRPPTPVPSRRSSTSSPLHSARASHASLDELVAALPALEEEGAAAASEDSSAAHSRSNSNSSAEGEVPAWYSPASSSTHSAAGLAARAPAGAESGLGGLDAAGSGGEAAGSGQLTMFYPPPPDQAEQMLMEGLDVLPPAAAAAVNSLTSSSSAASGVDLAGDQAAAAQVPAGVLSELSASQLVTPRFAPFNMAEEEAEEEAAHRKGPVPGLALAPQTVMPQPQPAQQQVYVQSPRTPTTDNLLSGAARQLAAGQVMGEAQPATHSSTASGDSGSSMTHSAQMVGPAPAAAAAATPTSAGAGTGVPQVDAALPAVQALQEQLALHGYVGRAAAIAGALVHAGGKAPATAANLAEAALDPADVVDFTDARTNLAQPDTVPDLMAAKQLHAPQRYSLGAAGPATLSTTLTTRSSGPAAAASPSQLAPDTPARGEEGDRLAQPTGAGRSVFAAMVDAVQHSSAAPAGPAGLAAIQEGEPGFAGADGAAGGGADGDASPHTHMLAPGAANGKTEAGTRQGSKGLPGEMDLARLHAASASTGGGRQHDAVWEEGEDVDMERLPRAPPPSFILPHHQHPAVALGLRVSAEGAEPEGGRSYSFQVHGAHAMPPRRSGGSGKSGHPLLSGVHEPSTPPSSPSHASTLYGDTSPPFSPMPSHTSATAGGAAGSVGGAGVEIPHLPSRLGSMLGGVSPATSYTATSMAPAVRAALSSTLLDEGDEEGEQKDVTPHHDESSHATNALAGSMRTAAGPLGEGVEDDVDLAAANPSNNRGTTAPANGVMAPPVDDCWGLGLRSIATGGPQRSPRAAAKNGTRSGGRSPVAAAGGIAQEDLLAVSASAAADAGLPPPSPRLLRCLEAAGSNPLADEEVPRSRRSPVAAAPAAQQSTSSASANATGAGSLSTPDGAAGADGEVVLLQCVRESPRSPHSPVRVEPQEVPL